MSEDVADLIYKYEANKAGARERGIKWEFTLQSWLKLWGDKITKRGTGPRDFVLCRKNDIGPYSPENCYIATKRHNSSVRGYGETRTNCIAIGNNPGGVDITKSRIDPKIAIESMVTNGGFRGHPKGRKLHKHREKIKALLKQAIDRGY